MADGNSARGACSLRRIGPGWRETALVTQVPFAGTAPCEHATDGVGARELETEAICAALLDRLAAGARASRETNGVVPYSPAVDAIL